MYHVVASDLDGTLLSPDHTLSPYAKETLKLLTEKGIHFVFATGRHHMDVAQIRDGLGISAFMITSNGARVHNTQGDLIFSHNLDPDIARDLYGVAHHNPDMLTHVYRDDEWFMNRQSPDEERFFKESVFKYQLFEPGLLETDGVSKIFFTCDSHEQLLTLEEAINARWGDRVNVSFSTLTCLEVMAGGVSKGHALEQVAKIIGFSLRECIAFGDGMNDYEMLSMAGKGCIMQNAHQRLKNVLPALEVIGSNAESAVPNYLRDLFLR
ncbi:sugar/pyridoxal phosphate phosphatase YigL [Brenneria tiliae]|uniref:Sugar/pyridoxal phosphate phosphatase YigL n=1 Tax=Brenneria tiliae TaxID=2914984 RepID=A0ABT0MRR6_9GAMM|nr:sugar/pyridoxal phosphate phosphatase YigL [Brenneria tiliae]MCL2892322.1 sugar/pyridoxal phosphate phosphatase YigL [Brenneria tiliae]MCL2897821.1 sugar/pyridoxal phosphate phosphatase YigL [Brenneria tiliae]MCL2902418.1 sugar/pyridoxal phosphate phosphatase YigL [Brenneria tiliae]